MMKRVSFFVFLLFTAHISAQQRPPLSGKRYELLSGIREADVKTRGEHSPEGRLAPSMNGERPSRFLTQNYEYIPRGSHLLVLGAGEGRNAVFLARKGHKVTRVSEEAEAVKKTQTLARQFGVRVNTVISSYSSFRSRAKSFDAVINFYHHSMELKEKFVKWLRPGGLIFYEAFTSRQLKKLKNKEEDEQKEYKKKYFLETGELLSLFPDMRILKYEEPLHLKKYPARIIVQKKPAKTSQN